MKIVVNGDMESFDKILKSIKRHKCNFFIKGTPESKKIEYTSKRCAMKFSDKKLTGAFLCNMVLKDIDRYLKDNKVPYCSDKFYIIRQYNTSLIKKNIGKEMCAIDINYCYWQTAFDLGFITERTFKRGLESDDLKEGRLIAIGSLNKRIEIEEYKSGEFVGRTWDHKRYHKYSPFYWKIIQTIYFMMLDLEAMFPNDLHMYLTDCAYVPKSKEAKIKKFFKERGYKCKSFMVKFKEVDEKKQTITWWDDKESRDKIIPFR